MTFAMRSRLPTAVGLLALLAAAAPAAAHPGHPAAGGDAGPGGAAVAAGLAHPFTGPDHLIAMLAVGLLAARLGGRCLWLLPALFVGGMAAGGAAAVALGPGHPVGGVEQTIAASVVALGLMLAAAGKLPRTLAIAVIPLFALFHGYAHLAEGAAFAVGGYAAGMVTGTVALHAVGVGLGLIMGRRPAATTTAWAWRIGGGAVTAAGVVLWVGTM